MSELLNNTLSIPVPPGFHVMDEAERGEMSFLVDGPGVCLSDPERHMIISTGYKQAGGLSSLLISGKDAAVHMERQIGEPMKPYGFKSDGLQQATIGGKNMDGFGYRYEVQDVAMYAQSYVIKYKKVFYYLHYYTREAMADENAPVWEQFLAEAVWKA